MITREVLAPPKLSRLAIVSLIALVASVGAVLCASFVAGERDAEPALAGAWVEPGITGYNASTTQFRSVIFCDGQGSSPGHQIFSSPRQAAWFGIGSLLLATDVTTADGAHHDTAVCIGSDPLCVYFEAAPP